MKRKKVLFIVAKTISTDGNFNYFPLNLLANNLLFSCELFILMCDNTHAQLSKWPESIEWFIEGQVFPAVLWSGSSPTPSPLSRQYKLERRETERVNFLAGERRRGWARAESYGRKKDWPSINHAILSARDPLARLEWTESDSVGRSAHRKYKTKKTIQK